MTHKELPGADESSAADHPADELAAGIDSRGQGSRSAFTWNRPAAAARGPTEIDETGRLIINRDLTSLLSGRVNTVDQLRREYQRLTPVLYSPAHQFLEQLQLAGAARAAVVVANPLGRHLSEIEGGSGINGAARIIADFRSGELERFVSLPFDVREDVSAPSAMIQVPKAALGYSLEWQHAAAYLREDRHCRDVLLQFYDSNQDLLEPSIRTARDLINLIEARLMHAFEPEPDWRLLLPADVEANFRRIDIQSTEPIGRVPVPTRRQCASTAGGMPIYYRRRGRFAASSSEARFSIRDVDKEPHDWSFARGIGHGVRSTTRVPDFIRAYLSDLLRKSDGDPERFLVSLAELIEIEFISPTPESEPKDPGAHSGEWGPEAGSARMWNLGSGTDAANINRHEHTPFALAIGGGDNGAGGTEIERMPQSDIGRLVENSGSTGARTASLTKPKLAASQSICEEELQTGRLRILDLGEVCQVDLGNESVCVRKTKGMAILKFLVQKPNVEHGVIELWAAASGISPGRTDLSAQNTRGFHSRDGRVVAQSVDAPPMDTSDDTARREYRDALRDNSDDMSRAHELDDQATLQQLSDEREALLACVPPSLGGKEVTRIHSEQEERARKNVCKLIRTALEALRREAPAIERQVRGRVRTGYRCQFLDPTMRRRRP